jgi:prepilin-type N-terminal cleavage/methylation domain-containing protein
MNDKNLRPRGNHRHGFSLIELLVVIGLFAIVAAIAVPASAPAVGSYRLAGSAHALLYEISLAKMRAAAGFTRARLYVNRQDGTYTLQSWNKATNTWRTEGGTGQLPQGIWFGFDAISTPPPNTQATINQASACLSDSATLAVLNGTTPGAALSGTSCVQFNSRGIPIDQTGAPTGIGALYVTDGTAVYGATVSATGMAQLWWTPTPVVSWRKQ